MTIKEVQQVSLEILKDVHEFCVKNKIKYSIAYGTLIGAIRHKGFIPWDDDIDIIMMRDEYERFVSTYKSEKYVLIHGENMSNHLHVVVSDLSTTLKFPNSPSNRKFYKGGVGVDIFPIDKVPDNENAYWRLLKRIWFFMRLQRIGEVIDKRSMLASQIAHSFLWPFRNMFGAIGKKMMYQSNKRVSQTVGNLSLWYLRYPSFPAYYMDVFVDVEFEGHHFKAIKNYDDFMRGIYGDYMKLPPENQRIPRHSYIPYWRESKNCLR